MSRRQNRPVLAPPVINLYESCDSDAQQDAHVNPVPPLPSSSSVPRVPSTAVPHGSVRLSSQMPPPPSRAPVRAGPGHRVSRAEVPIVPCSRGPNSGDLNFASSGAGFSPYSHPGVEGAAAMRRDTIGQQAQNRAASGANDQQSAQYPHPQERQQQQQQQQQQQYVVQSAFTQKNPFRKQNFEEFSYSPDYSAPANMVLNSSSAAALSGFQRAVEGDFHAQQTSYQQHQQQLPRQRAFAFRVLNVSPDAIKVLQAGDWFLKWTRHGKVHERYLWLHVQRASLLWGRTPNPAVVMLSQVRLDDILSVRPDCIVDDATQRKVYRMHFVMDERTFIIATDQKEKFDIWYDTIKKLTETNEGKDGFNKLWSTSSGYRSAIAATKWNARYSPLHAIWRGYSAPTGPVLSSSVGLGNGAQGRVLPSD